MSLKDSAPVWSVVVASIGLLAVVMAAFAAGVSQATRIETKQFEAERRIDRIDRAIDTLLERVQQTQQDVIAIRAKVEGVRDYQRPQ